MRIASTRTRLARARSVRAAMHGVRLPIAPVAQHKNGAALRSRARGVNHQGKACDRAGGRLEARPEQLQPARKVWEEGITVGKRSP